MEKKRINSKSKILTSQIPVRPWAGCYQADGVGDCDRIVKFRRGVQLLKLCDFRYFFRLVSDVYSRDPTAKASFLGESGFQFVGLCGLVELVAVRHKLMK